MEGRAVFFAAVSNMEREHHSIVAKTARVSVICGLLAVGLYEHAKQDIEESEDIRNDAAILYCAYGPDDPEILQQFLEIGKRNPIHSAAKSNKPRLLRYLIQLGFCVNETDAQTKKMPLDDTDYMQIAHLLLDAGAHCFDSRYERILITQLRKLRESVRMRAISVMGANDGTHRDVARIIARAVWALRGIIKE